MDVRNENIGILVAVAVMAIGGTLTGWDPSDGAAQLIFVVAFVVGFCVSTVLNERERHSSRR